MKIKGPGIVLEAEVKANKLKFSVVKQAGITLNIIKLNKGGIQHLSGYSVKCNARPAYNSAKKRFYVRGWDVSHDKDEVVAEFDNHEEADVALGALNEMIETMKVPDEAVRQTHGGTVFHEGGTSHVRGALISKVQAEKLVLTGKHFFPEQRDWVGAVKPILTTNSHFNEHIGQIVDVLNKSKKKGVKTNGVINPHKINHEAAEKAVNAVRKMFDDAEHGDYLVAVWRLVTGLRGPDFVD